ncbi:MAG TPA: hypothetical protein VG498_06470 [Terriglobales bacterium]|nr:hypothetical protein [Terriglobales bacterium]
MSFGTAIAFNISEWHRAHLFSLQQNQRIFATIPMIFLLRQELLLQNTTLAFSPQEKWRCLSARIEIVRTSWLLQAQG